MGLRRSRPAEIRGESRRSVGNGLVLSMDRRLPLGVWAKINLRCGIVFGRIRRFAPRPDGEFRVFIRVDELLPR